MTLLEQMRADAVLCNRKLRRTTAAGPMGHHLMNRGRTPAVAQRHNALRQLMGRGHSQQQLAEMLGVKIGTIKSDMAIIRSEDAHARS